jgi:hypothetical protein
VLPIIIIVVVFPCLFDYFIFLDLSNEGLVMSAETSPELRRRIVTATSAKEPKIDDTCL